MNKKTREPKQHYIPQFYLRKFTCDTNNNRLKKMERFYTINKNGIVNRSRINSVCQIKGYNSTNEEIEKWDTQFNLPPGTPIYLLTRENETPMEIKFGQMERVFSKSIDAITKGVITEIDIINLKYFIIYLLSNQPAYRAVLTRHDNKSTSIEERIKGKGYLTLLNLQTEFPFSPIESTQEWKYLIERTDPIENRYFITSDNPVLIQNSKTNDFIGGWEFSFNKNEPNTMGGTHLGSKGITEDTIFFLPLSPFISIYLFKNKNRAGDIMNNRKNEIKMNRQQINQSKILAFSHSKKYLDSMYIESLDFDLNRFTMS